MTYAINDIDSLADDYQLHLYMDSMYGTVNFPVGNNGFTENHLQTVLFNENIASANGLKRASVNILVDDAKELSGKCRGDANCAYTIYNYRVWSYLWLPRHTVADDGSLRE